jgi:histidine kinase
MRLSKITIKVIVSYVLLICVSVVAGYIVFKEINKLSNQEKINQEDRNKIVQISKILSMVNETENAGRIVLEVMKRKHCRHF